MNRTERLKLKENKFKCHNPANKEKIDELFEVKLKVLFYTFISIIKFILHFYLHYLGFIKLLPL